MKILVTGYKGMLGSILAEKLKTAGHEVIGADLPEYDLTDKKSMAKLFNLNSFDFIYNCAAFTNVDLCETEKEKAYAVNSKLVENLVEQTKQIPLLHISTDYVFDGKNSKPYQVNDKLNPDSEYGKSKAQGELVLKAGGHQKYFIVRTAWLYGPNGKNFVETIIDLAAKKPELKVVDDQRGAPTYTHDLAEALVDFLNIQDYGVYHYTNSGETTWYNFTLEIFKLLGIKTKVIPCTTAEFPRPARRPAYSVLDLSKTEQVLGKKTPTWQDGLKRYLETRKK